MTFTSFFFSFLLWVKVKTNTINVNSWSKSIATCVSGHQQLIFFPLLITVKPQDLLSPVRANKTVYSSAGSGKPPEEEISAEPHGAAHCPCLPNKP